VAGAQDGGVTVPNALQRTAPVVALGVAALLLTAGPAAAHAGLIGSDPADGVVLDSPPQTMTLRFDEPVVVDLTALTVTDVATTDSATRGVRATGGGEASTVSFSLPRLTKGAYEVNWQTVSGSDRHTSTGVVVFGVGARPPTVAVADPWPPAGDAALRAASLIGLTGAVGSVLVLLLMAARLEPGPPRVSLQRTAAAVGAVLAGVGACGDIGLLVRAAPGAGVLTFVTGTTYGQRWAAGFVALVALAVLLAVAGRVRTMAALGLAGCVGLVAVAVQPLTTHLASGSQALLGTVAATGHLAAAGGWAGGLIVLVVVAARVWRRPHTDDDPTAIRDAVVGFAWLALPCAAVLVLTGLLLTGRQVATPDALLFTHYGRVLMVKVALTVVIGLLGLRHARRLHSAGDGNPVGLRNVPRTVAVEAGLFVVALGAAAFLGAASPPRGIPWLVPAAAIAPLPVTSQVGDLTVTTSVTPGVTGANVLAVQAREDREPSPGPILLVSAQVSDPSGSLTQVPLAASTTENRWRAALDMPTPGTYDITVTLARSGLPDTVVTRHWPITPAPVAARPVDVSNVALGPIARWLAFAGLIAIAVAGSIGLALRGSDQELAEGPGQTKTP